MASGNNEKYQRSGLTEESAQYILDALTEYMEDERPYLDPKCSIHFLAEELQVSKHNISQVLNQKLNKNFYTFINEYRIRAFKEFIIDPDFRHYSIISIAFESGFNSKSSFNMVFKKLEKQTPSEYLEEKSGNHN